MSNKEITKCEYEAYEGERDRLQKELEAAQEELRIVSEDGTDDENPAYGYALIKIESIIKRLNALNQQYSNCKIVKEKGVLSHQFGEHCQSITLHCVYDDGDEDTNTMTIGRGGMNSISIQSPLYLFLKGKEVGFAGRFINKMPSGDVFSYDVEIIDIEF